MPKIRKQAKRVRLSYEQSMKSKLKKNILSVAGKGSTKTTIISKT